MHNTIQQIHRLGVDNHAGHLSTKGCSSQPFSQLQDRAVLSSTSDSLVTVHRNIYSVHSRLIGEMVEARVGPDTVEIWYADRKVEEVPRLRGRSKHRIDYRHIIDWLVRKPGGV